MIEVHPIDDAARTAALYAEAGLPCGDDCFGVAAYDGETVLGHCLFSLNRAGITVFALTPADDLPLADGILRSALYVASVRGVRDAFYAESAPVPLLRALAFLKDEAERRLDIDKLTEGCACEKAQP